MKTKFKLGQRLLWDNGYSYSIVEYIGPSIFEGSERVVRENNPDLDVIVVDSIDLYEYSLEQESYLKLKYDL